MMHWVRIMIDVLLFLNQIFKLVFGIISSFKIKSDHNILKNMRFGHLVPISFPPQHNLIQNSLDKSTELKYGFWISRRRGVSPTQMLPQALRLHLSRTQAGREGTCSTSQLHYQYGALLFVFDARFYEIHKQMGHNQGKRLSEETQNNTRNG